MAATSVQEAILFGLLESIAVVLPLSAAMRIWRAPKLAFDCLLPICIIIAYWIAYNKFLPFPPIGAVNKLPYVLCAGLGLGVICDLVQRKRVGTIACCIFAATAALYIGWSRLQSGSTAVILAGLAGVLVQLAISLEPHDVQPGYDIDRGAVLGLSSAGCAFVALLGASSSSLQLCLTFAASIAAVLIVQVLGAQFRFLFASRMAGVGGLHAVMCVVLLITQKADEIAALILCCAFISPYVGHAVARRLGIHGAFARHFIVSGVASLVIMSACGVAYVHYLSDFPT